MEKITIHIREDHVENSARGESSRCMIANALREQLDLTDKDYVGVYSGTEMFVNGIPVKPRANQRAATTRRIGLFDIGKKVRPFSFDLEVPERFRELLRVARSR